MLNRPITLLCLSDLHLVPEKSGEELLQSLRLTIKNVISEAVFWTPDYVVIAGDMVEASRKEYDQVKKYIQTFINDNVFNLHPFKIIAVPGNHDKDFPFLTKESSLFQKIKCGEEKRKNRNFVESLKSDSPFKFDLKRHFKENFVSFGNFYLDYVKNNYENGELVGQYEYPDEFLGPELSDIALTSGLKIFHDTKICFLCINSEWVYMPEKYADKSDLLTLCTPVVFSSINKFKRKYKDYTLITVMHRNPFEFPWETRNRVEHNKPDILRYLYQYSDIILTGHEHIEKILPPHKMENHAQLFQLGSASVENRNNNTINHYLAALIHLDPYGGFIRLCNFKNDGIGTGWKVSMDEKKYYLDKKDYTLSVNYDSLNPAEEKSSCAAIPIKSFEQNDILSALRRRYIGIEKAGYKISFFCLNDSDLLKKISSTSRVNGKNAIFIYTHNEEDHSRYKRVLGDFLSQKEVRFSIYSKSLIISEVRFIYNDPDCFFCET